jgi:hypothetical protein
MSAKHTPGPWSVGELCANRINVHSREDGIVAQVWRYDISGDANARLIAAASDLFDACADALGTLTHHPDVNEQHKWPVAQTIAKLRAAIAKA